MEEGRGGGGGTGEEKENFRGGAGERLEDSTIRSEVSFTSLTR